jgi:hypothetical protein
MLIVSVLIATVKRQISSLGRCLLNASALQFS